MRRLRLGIFNRETAPTDGGADTLLAMLTRQLAAQGAADGQALELVPVPWEEWTYKKQPLRYAWSRLARACGGEIPLFDLRPVCQRLGLDLAYFPAPAFARIDVPFVFTLWDAGHRTIPDFPEVRSARDPWTQREAMCRRMIAQASFTIVGNETGAVEVRTFFGAAAERVVAIPFPNPDFGDVTEAVPTWLPTRPFFLYPAQAWPHKNHFTLLRALALATQRGGIGDASGSGRGGADFELVFVGSDKGNLAYLKSVAAELGVSERVHFRGFVARGELKALYQRATALVFPSLLGPNNLPPQEAASLGCPVLLSDLPGHREQLGDGAHYVAPLDAVAWSEAMQRAVADAAWRNQISANGRAAVAGYTSAAYAARLGEVFTTLAATRRLWGR